MKKILLVSDIITVFSGGIEMYILNTKNLLAANGFQVKTFGITRSKKAIKKRRGYLLPLTGFNIFSAISLIWKNIQCKPDIIRFHSMNRYHGRLPVMATGLFKSKKLMMYHDLGYFHPFPHLVTEEIQVLSWNFKNFMVMGFKAKKLQSGIAKKIFWRLTIGLKFCSIQLLRLSLLMMIDKHLVPSEFMVKYLENRGVDKQKIEVVPHFIIS